MRELTADVYAYMAPLRTPAWAGRNAPLAMTLICSAQFVIQLDFSVVNVALSSAPGSCRARPGRWCRRPRYRR